MSLENLGFQNIRQFAQTNKTEQSHQHIYQAQMQQLFDTHNLILTRILQHGLAIPKDLFEQIKAESASLKKIFFGLDNQLLEASLLPPNQEEFVVFYTNTVPVVMPITFLQDDAFQQELGLDPLIVNMVEEQDWWEAPYNEFEFSRFLRAGLMLFSTNAFIKRENVKHVKFTRDPFLPERALTFSMRCNIYSLLMFFLTHRQYFPTLQAGIVAYLKFVNSV